MNAPTSNKHGCPFLGAGDFTGDITILKGRGDCKGGRVGRGGRVGWKGRETARVEGKGNWKDGWKGCLVWWWWKVRTEWSGKEVVRSNVWVYIFFLFLFFFYFLFLFSFFFFCKGCS